jgi:hypothetical protein
LAAVVYSFDDQLNIAGTRTEGEERGRSQCEKVLHLNELFDVSGQDLMSIEAKIRVFTITPKLSSSKLIKNS